MSTATATRPDGSTYSFESNDSVVVHGVDANGAYLGLVDPALAAQQVAGPPPAEGSWLWIGGSWQRQRTLAEAQAGAINAIDICAGRARMRYITSVPGQEGTYLQKAQEAQAFVDAAGAGTPPPYVQAEADATGMAAIDAANSILTIANLWSAQIGPAIERERRRGKLNVDAATTIAAVESALAAAQTALDAI